MKIFSIACLVCCVSFTGLCDIAVAAEKATLYDVALTFGSNLRIVHSLNNCPTPITGGAGFKHGRHMVMDKKTPLCNLWLSPLNGAGVNTESFGDATGIIPELFKA